MEFTIKKSSKDNLIEFIDWIKDRAKDPVHKNNKDLIADFLEQVVVVELKKLENSPKEFDVKIDIPDDDIPQQGPDPYILIHKVVAAMAGEMTDKDGNKLDVNDLLNINVEEEEEEEESDPSEQDTVLIKDGDKVKSWKVPDIEAKGEIFTGSKGYSRTGNNHKKGKKRPLSDAEREYITQEFIKKNGNLEDKDCTDIAKHLGLSINGKTPWQVTGWVSELCRRVADGKLKLTTQPVAGTPATPQFVPNPLRKRIK